MEAISYKKLEKKEIILSKNYLIDFLFHNLDQFGDERKAISTCLDYIINDPRGGNVFVALDNNKICGVTTILNTDMKFFAPEFFLVYLAVNKEYRGKGIGKKILDLAKKNLEGSICLHVEHNNPAKRLYEREGFTNKYLELRFSP